MKTVKKMMKIKPMIKVNRMKLLATLKMNANTAEVTAIDTIKIAEKYLAVFGMLPYLYRK